MKKSYERPTFARREMLSTVVAAVSPIITTGG